MRRIGLVAAACAALAATPLAAKSLNWSFAQDVLMLDPQSSNNTFTNAFLANMYESLVRMNEKIEIEPALATSWERTSPTVWRFRLRRGVKFHDGADFDADDVVFTWQRINTPGALARGNVVAIRDVRAIDPHTVEIETHAPFPILLNAIVNFFILDRGWAEKNGTTVATNTQGQQENYAARHVNGTGPFRLVSRAPDQETVLEAFAGWWDKPAHNLTRVSYQPIRSAATRTAGLISGQLDVLSELPLQDIPRVEANPALQVVEGPELRTIYFGFDHFRDELLYSDVKGKNPFRDIRVRRAVYQAIDIEAIRRNVMRGQSWPAGMMASPFLNGAPADLNTRILPYDPDAAKRLLAEAGYPNGFTVGLACPNDRYVYDERICQAVSGMLARVGIRITPQFETLAIWSRRVGSLDVSFYMLGHAGLPLADVYSTLAEVIHSRGERIGGLNYGRYSNPRIDALIARIAEAGNEAERRAMIREALAIEREDIGHIPLHQQPIVWAAKKGIELRQGPDNQMRLWRVRVN